MMMQIMQDLEDPVVVPRIPCMHPAHRDGAYPCKEYTPTRGDDHDILPDAMEMRTVTMGIYPTSSLVILTAVGMIRMAW